MRVGQETIDRFYKKIRTQKVQFVVNDPVQVTVGLNEGRFGSVISVESLISETVYLIEPGEQSWDDMFVCQSNLQLLE